eukprot:gene9907-20604_t
MVSRISHSTLDDIIDTDKIKNDDGYEDEESDQYDTPKFIPAQTQFYSHALRQRAHPQNTDNILPRPNLGIALPPRPLHPVNSRGNIHNQYEKDKEKEKSDKSSSKAQVTYAFDKTPTPYIQNRFSTSNNMQYNINVNMNKQETQQQQQYHHNHHQQQHHQYYQDQQQGNNITQYQSPAVEYPQQQHLQQQQSPHILNNSNNNNNNINNNTSPTFQLNKQLAPNQINEIKSSSHQLELQPKLTKSDDTSIIQPQLQQPNHNNFPLDNSNHESPNINIDITKDREKEKDKGLRGSRPLVSSLKPLDLVAGLTRQQQTPSSTSTSTSPTHKNSLNSTTTTNSSESSTSNSTSQLSHLSHPSPSPSLTSISFQELSLSHVLGGGSFGQVWEGVWKGTPVAVKILSVSQVVTSIDSNVLSAFDAEVAMLASLRHPNICLYMGACLKPPHRAIVTELVSRGSLWQVLRTVGLFPGHTSTSSSTTSFWPWWVTHRVIEDSCRGLLYLHSLHPCVLHRDMKSANLLLDDSFHVK